MNNTHKAKFFLNHLFLQGLWIFPLKINLLIEYKSNKFKQKLFFKTDDWIPKINV